MRGRTPRVAPFGRISFRKPLDPAAARKARGFVEAFESGNPNRRRACSVCRWQSATARASAASDGSGVSLRESKARTIICI
jgi:hypothetical protein